MGIIRSLTIQLTTKINLKYLQNGKEGSTKRDTKEGYAKKEGHSKEEGYSKEERYTKEEGYTEESRSESQEGYPIGLYEKVQIIRRSCCNHRKERSFSSRDHERFVGLSKEEQFARSRKQIILYSRQEDGKDFRK